VEEFNKKFNDLVKSLPNDILPSNTAILIYYMEAFDGEMRYALRDKDPQNLKLAQALALNMQDARKSNIPGLTRGSSSQPYEEKKKSSNDGMKQCYKNRTGTGKTGRSNRFLAPTGPNRLIKPPLTGSVRNRFFLPELASSV
jgi:hypothetical protein